MVNTSSIQRGITATSLILLGVLAVNSFMFATGKQKAHLDTQQQITEMEEQRKIADASSRTQVIKIQSVQIVDYVYNSRPPRFDIRAFQLRASVVKVLDRNQLCIGVIDGGVFKFRGFYRGVCSDEWIREQLKEV